MTDTANLVGAPPGVPGAIHAASVPPLLDAVCEHAYAWVAAHVPFETAVELSPLTHSADRTLREHGTVTTADLRRDDLRTRLPDRFADLVVWAAPAPPRERIDIALAEARRLCRPTGVVVCVLPAWAAEQAAEIAGLREEASVELRPLIGAAIGSVVSAEEANPVGAPATYRIVVLRPSDAPREAQSVPGEEPATTTLRDGERALRVELAALSTLQGMRVDERAELLERLERAERNFSEQRDHGAELMKRLRDAEGEQSDLRAQLKAAEANVAHLELAQKALHEAEQLRTDLELHRQWLGDIQRSLSWRLTRPLRFGKGTLRR